MLEVCIVFIVLFDKSCVNDVEKVIWDFDLGVNFFNDGNVVCCVFLVLIEECCKEYIKMVKIKVEEGCIVVCNVCCVSNDVVKK